MKPLMDLESASPGVALGASSVRALEGFLPRVGQFMRLQVPLRDELLLTQAADEWTLTCVRAHVRLQVTSLRKFLKAFFEGTDEYLLLFLGPLHLLDLRYSIYLVNIW
jgi:hypothetical protein